MRLLPEARAHGVDHVTPLVDSGPRRAEALYFYAVSARDLGDVTTYVRTTRRVVDEFPTETWAEEALNALASYYVRRDDDDAADEVFRELYQKLPKGLRRARRVESRLAVVPAETIRRNGRIL